MPCSLYLVWSIIVVGSVPSLCLFVLFRCLPVFGFCCAFVVCIGYSACSTVLFLSVICFLLCLASVVFCYCCMVLLTVLDYGYRPIGCLLVSVVRGFYLLWVKFLRFRFLSFCSFVYSVCCVV